MKLDYTTKKIGLSIKIPKIVIIKNEGLHFLPAGIEQRDCHFI